MKITVLGEKHFSMYFIGFGTIQKLPVSCIIHCLIWLSRDRYKSTNGKFKSPQKEKNKTLGNQQKTSLNRSEILS